MTLKRFIAGAVCPRCGNMDRLRTWRDEVREFRECVDCGYEDAMRLDGAPEPEELETRVNQEARPEPETPVASDGEQVIKFVPNPTSK